MSNWRVPDSGHPEWRRKNHLRPCRPAYLVNEAGGVIRWDGWLRRTAPCQAVITAMVFDDGKYVTAKSEGYINLTAPGAVESMRALADG